MGHDQKYVDKKYEVVGSDLIAQTVSIRSQARRAMAQTPVHPGSWSVASCARRMLTPKF